MLFPISGITHDRSLPGVMAIAPERAVLNGEEYAMVVPADCVYTDNEGAFVCRLKQTPDGWKTAPTPPSAGSSAARRRSWWPHRHRHR